MGRTTLLTVLLLAFFAGPVWAQETARERARATLSPTVFGEVEALAIQADREGIPSEPLFNKALEGAAKGVQAERLLPALSAYATRLRTAHRAFGPTASASLVVAGADALQRGVESEAGLSRGFAAIHFCLIPCAPLGLGAGFAFSFPGASAPGY